MNKKITLLALVAVIIVAGAYVFPRAPQQIATASPAGSTFGTAKIAAVVMNLLVGGANSTSTTLVNTDANSRYVTGARVGCTSVGTSTIPGTLLLSIGTTTTANPVSFTSDVAVLNALPLATSSPNMSTSTNAKQFAGAGAALWRSNEKMTFWFNATNTAVCTIGVDYLGS